MQNYYTKQNKTVQKQFCFQIEKKMFLKNLEKYEAWLASFNLLWHYLTVKILCVACGLCVVLSNSHVLFLVVSSG